MSLSLFFQLISRGKYTHNSAIYQIKVGLFSRIMFYNIRTSTLPAGCPFFIAGMDTVRLRMSVLCYGNGRRGVRTSVLSRNNGRHGVMASIRYFLRCPLDLPSRYSYAVRWIMRSRNLDMACTEENPQWLAGISLDQGTDAVGSSNF